MSDGVGMPRASAKLPRRQALGLALVGVASLAGCGIRLEDSAPNVPLIPRRAPIAGEAALLALVANCAELAAAAATWAAPPKPWTSASATALFERQGAVIRRLLDNAGVPHPPPSPLFPSNTVVPGSAGNNGGQASDGSAPTPARATAAATTTAAMTTLMVAPIADEPILAACDATVRPTVASVVASRYAFVLASGGAIPTPQAAMTGSAPSTTTSPSSPTGDTATPSSWPAAAAEAQLAATRSARYGFQVVAAQADAADRPGAMSDLERLDSLVTEQTARLTGPTPPPPLGYDLPFPVTTPDAARKLAAAVTTGLVTAYGAQLPSVGTSPGAFHDLVEWLGTATAMALRWGAAPEPFPGMTG